MMKKEQLIDAMNHADEDLLVKADTMRKGKMFTRKVLISWTAMAACLCLVVGLAVGSLVGGKNSTSLNATVVSADETGELTVNEDGTYTGTFGTTQLELVDWSDDATCENVVTMTRSGTRSFYALLKDGKLHLLHYTYSGHYVSQGVYAIKCDFSIYDSGTEVKILQNQITDTDYNNQPWSYYTDTPIYAIPIQVSYEDVSTGNYDHFISMTQQENLYVLKDGTYYKAKLKLESCDLSMRGIVAELTYYHDIKELSIHFYSAEDEQTPFEKYGISLCYRWEA